MAFDDQLTDDDVHRLYQEKRYRADRRRPGGRSTRPAARRARRGHRARRLRPLGELDADDIRDLTALRRTDSIEAARIDGRIDYPTTTKEN